MRIYILALLVAGCGRFVGEACRLPSTPLVTERPEEARTRNLVLVTIDGVRWQEIFDGADAGRAPGLACGRRAALLPNLYALARIGVAVQDIRSSGPNFVSLPGYREIVTGRASVRCTSNECRAIDEATLLDELALPPDQIAVASSWERVGRAAARWPRHITLSSGRHGGSTRDGFRVNGAASRILDEGSGAGAWPGYLDYRPDRYTAALARQYLLEKRPRFLWVALGDTDEFAHRSDYAGYLDALRSADRFVGELWALLGAMGRYGAETTIIVTTDHGRAANFASHGKAPESARGWLLAAGGAVPPSHAMPRTHRLRDIAPTMRLLLGLPADRSIEAGEPIAEVVSAVPILYRQAKR
jgi:hypothetical protein